MKSIFYITKYLPVICGILLTIHCGLLLGGEDDEFLKEFCSFNPTLCVVFTILSYRLHFCFVHRMNIWFDCLMDFFIKAQRYDIFSEIGCDVFYFRLSMLIVGIVIQGLLFYKIYGCKKCRHERIGRCFGRVQVG